MKNNFGYSWRAYLIYIFLSISLLILVFRIVSLQYIEGDFLKSKGAKKIISLNILGAPEGVKAVQDAHPDVDIYIAQVDERLDDNKYIRPGLGDAGDRAFNTND